MDDGFGAVYDISCGEDAFSGGHFVFVYDEETFVGAFQSYCCADQAVSWSLADGDDRGICFHLVFAFLVSDDFIILINDRSLEYRAGFRDALDRFSKDKLCAIQLCIRHFMRVRRYMRSAGIQCHLQCTVSKSCPRNVHCRISHSNNGDFFSQIICCRIFQIVNAEMHIRQTFPRNPQVSCFPHSCSNKHACISVAEKIIDRQNCSDRSMRTDADTHRKDLLFQTIQDRFRQTEFRDSVTCDTADLVLLLKDRHLIPMLCQNDRHRQSCRTCPDHCHRFFLFFWNLKFHSIQISVRNIVLNTGKMHRIILKQLRPRIHDMDRHSVSSLRQIIFIYHAIFFHSSPQRRCADSKLLRHC